MTKLAESHFLTRPSERLDHVDIYEVKNSEIRGAGSRGGDGLDNAVLSMMRAPDAFVDNVVQEAIARGSNESDALDGAVSTLAKTKQRVEGALGDAFGHLSDLSGDLKKAVTDNVGTMIEPTARYLASYGGELKEIDDVIPDKMTMVSSAVSTLLPKGEYQEGFMKALDVGAEEAVYATLMAEVVSVGAVDAMGPLLDNMALPDSAKRVALDAMDTALKGGNLDGLKILSQYASSNEILSRYPDLTSLVLETYQHHRDQDEKEQFDDLVQTVDDIQPGWYTAQRNGRTITRLEPFRNASDDARAAFLRNMGEGQYLIEALLADEYQPKDLVSLARSQYPHAAI